MSAQDFYSYTAKVLKAEKSVVRAAMGVVNAEGWSFDKHGLYNVVLFPDAMRRLEIAIGRLREARQEAAKKRRKHAKR